MEPASTYSCPNCGRVSHNPNDARERYCGYCKAFEGHNLLETCCKCQRLLNVPITAIMSAKPLHCLRCAPVGNQGYPRVGA